VRSATPKPAISDEADQILGQNQIDGGSEASPETRLTEEGRGRSGRPTSALFINQTQKQAQITLLTGCIVECRAMQADRVALSTDAQFRVRGLDHSMPGLDDPRQQSSQLLRFHLEPPDMLVQSGLDCFMFPLLRGSAGHFV